MKTLSVRVTTGAKKEKVEELKNGRLKVYVKAKPKQGAANARVIELVAAYYKVPATRVRIVRGHKTPSKILEIK